MGALKLGPLIIKYDVLFALGAGIAVYAILKRVTAKDQVFQKQFFDVLINSVLLFIIFYKGSILVFHPDLLQVHLLGALSLHGGIKEGLAGLAAGGMYFFYQYKKKKWLQENAGRAILYAAVTYITAYWFLQTLFFLVV
ncbi:hypothetical protein [Mesobacillus foraminis]|uniref:hypothetical protein n=1 Tax=Mesobacillus foraminis TaxID=279826 RepID=UPI000EF4EA94|nr:hypothetical protein [Mesobacillus foraminis]